VAYARLSTVFPLVSHSGFVGKIAFRAQLQVTKESLLRILIADDHEGIRRGIQALLSSREDWAVCAHAVDGLDAVEKARQHRPDIVLMDISMPAMDGIEATRLIRQDVPASEVIVVSQNDAALASAKCIAAGARAYIAKNNLARDLIPTIEKITNLNANPQSSGHNDAHLNADSHPLARAHQAPSPSQTSFTTWLIGGGEMGDRMRSLDWSRTALGAVEHWPQSLKTSISICLSSQFPIVMYWGPEYVVLYNDAYSKILGGKHPWALGQRCCDCWAEIWDTIGPMLDGVVNSGQATWSDDLLLLLQRSGYAEECYFSFSFSPIRVETGNVGGVFTAVIETTNKVIGERRLKTLRDLAARAVEASSEEDAWRIAINTLSENQHDLPFAMLCKASVQSGSPGVLSTSNLSEDHPMCASPFQLGSILSDHLADVFRRKQLTAISKLSDLAVELPRGEWQLPPTTAALVPITDLSQERVFGVLFTAISPHKALDESYRTFLELVARQIAGSIADARADEEERKRAEALAEIDRAKTVFFSNVSHEFRTPLTLMLGPVQELLSRSHTHLTPTAAQQLEIVNRNGARLLRLVNTLLDFSRIEAGRVNAVYQATDLAGFTADLAGMFRSATDRAGLRLEVDCPPMNGVAYVDRDMWEKIVLNLISNAFKFTFDGGISVSIKQVDQSAELRVSDTGVGIPAEEIPRLFNRFYRIANTRSRTHEGSGIGLSLVNELVKLHGGSIQVESTVEAGSTFIVIIPLGQDHLATSQIGGERSQSSTATGASPFVEEALRWLPDIEKSNVEELPLESELLPSLPGGSARKSRVLIADDNADMRQYLIRLLSSQYDVTPVADGQSALDSIRKELPDLVLSDIMMPNLDGFSLLQHLRSNSSTNTLPVILLSARAGEDARVEGMKAGADDYLVKPFSARELLARVQSHLDLARVRKEADKRIRENEERLRAFITASSDIVYRMSPDWSRMHFLQGKDFVPDTNDPSSGWLDKYIPPDDQLQVLSAIREAIRKKTTFELEHRVLRADGSPGWTFSRAIPVLDDQGSIVEWFGTASDITARRNMEEELRQAQSNLEFRVKQRTEQLERAQGDLRDLSAKLLQLQDEERRRIASDLHDSAGQTLTVLGITLAELGAMAGAGDRQFSEKMAQIQELVQRVTQEIRTTSYLLHPPLLDESGISPALAWYIDGLSKRTNLHIELSISPQFGRLPKEMELAIFRIVQECLTNVLRHSGSEKAKITVERDNLRVAIAVQDFGKGIPDDKLARMNDAGAGVGVRGMKQRVRHFNGEIGIASGKSGTTISVTLPIATTFAVPDANGLKSLAPVKADSLSHLN
jgi:signal transduction histidine kinase/DNA-binding response OmpR family regulator